MEMMLNKTDSELVSENDPFTFHLNEKDLEKAYVRSYWSVPFGEVVFENDESAANAYKKIVEWIEEKLATNENKQLFFDGFEHQPNSSRIYFKVFSETEEHIYWQLNYFLDFCKTLTGIEKLDTDLVKTVNPGFSWNKEK